MSFKADEMVIDKLLNNAVYCIPRNQRRYVWKEQNWSDLFDDLELVVNGSSSSHFIGSIVLKREEKREGEDFDRYTVIDGQQRILTLTIFIAAIMFVFKERGMEDDFEGTKRFLVFKNTKNREISIVDTDYHMTLNQIISHLLKDTTDKIKGYPSITAFCNSCSFSQQKDRQITSAFRYFYEKIKNTDVNRLIRLRDAIKDTGYVNIVSTTDEDSYTIFEILNARGLDLEDHELLKNYIMRYLQPIERRDIAKLYWEEIETDLGSTINDFFRHYATHKYDYDKKKESSVYKTIQNAIKGQVKNQAEKKNSISINKCSELLLEDIKRKSSYYKRIVYPTPNNSVEYDVLSFFKSKRVSVFRPLILSSMHLLDSEVITEKQHNSFLEFLKVFFICFKIIGQENSNLLSSTIQKYSYETEKTLSFDVLNNCMAALNDRLPTLDSFINSVRNIGYSHHWSLYKDPKEKERCFLVLQVLEEYISRRPLNIDVTIEHILPDSNSIDNAQIGNLFLLEESLNRRCDNLDLMGKMPIYLESKLECPRGFANRYARKLFDPHKRTEFLAKFLYNNVLGIPDQKNSI